MTTLGKIEDVIGPFQGTEISDREAHLINRDIIERTSFFEDLALDQSSSESKIQTLHRIAVVGARNENGETLERGKYRRCAVGFGDDYVAPEYRDLPEMMGTFVAKLESLSQQVTSEEDINLVATWSHLVLIAIHPFEDGNGRTARALIEYMRYSKCSALGIPYSPMSLPSPSVRDAQVKRAVDDFYASEIKPKDFEKLIDTSGHDLPTFFYELSASGRRHEYFASLKANLLNHINSIDTIDDLRGIKQAVELSERLESVDNWLTGKETISLKGQEIIQRSQEIFT